MKVLPEKVLLLTALALWCLVINTRETTACISAERGALVSFNASIKDPNGRLSSWQGENCCNWSGVRCSKKTGHVVRLDLGGYALEGEINPSLAGLTYLVYLNLSKSDFGRMSIPEFIGSFNMLRYLDLSGARFGCSIPPQLTGEIPSELGFLTKLHMLNLSRNCIEGSIPGELGALTVLESLDLSWNNLAGPIPQSLTSLVSLIHLNLSYNDLSGKIPLQGQLQTFTEDSYLGNVNLCGFPLSTICLPNSSSRKHRRHKLHPHFDLVTYMFVLLGFASGFSAVLVILISSAAARRAYIQFTDSMHDKLHLHAAVEMKLRLLLVWNHLRSVVLNTSVEDSSLRRWSASQQYSSALAYRAFFHGPPSILGAKELWKAKAPPRVKFFFWLAISGRCWTSDRLQHHNLQSSGPCALCDQEAETIGHLTLGCVYSRELWSRLLNPHGLLALVPHPDSELSLWWLTSRKHLTKLQRQGFDSLVLLVAWSLWKERNRRVFLHQAVQPVELVRLVGAEGADWVFAGNSGLSLFLGGVVV